MDGMTRPILKFSFSLGNIYRSLFAVHADSTPENTNQTSAISSVSHFRPKIRLSKTVEQLGDEPSRDTASLEGIRNLPAIPRSCSRTLNTLSTKVYITPL